MISKTAQYALRALVVLAQSKAAVSGSHLSTLAAVPFTYLQKIMLTLRRTGFVIASRGKGGGYRLSRSPESILLFEIVEQFDRLGASFVCLLGFSECSDSRSKPGVKHVCWRDVQSANLAFLKTK